MAEELADTHAAEQPDVEVVSGAEIPEKAAEKPVTIREAPKTAGPPPGWLAIRKAICELKNGRRYTPQEP